MYVLNAATTAVAFLLHFILFRGAICCSTYGEKCTNGEIGNSVYTWCVYC